MHALRHSVPEPAPEGAAIAWHALSGAAAAARLAVGDDGLSAEEVARRLARDGPNALPEPPRRRWWRMLLDQFTDFMILVLLAAALISGAIGDLEDTVAILVIVLMNGLIGFVQEFRAERAVAALKRLAAPSATVRRGGRVCCVPSANVVAGDVLLLEAGNIVAADARLVGAVQLRVDESLLTGESVPVDKQAAGLCEAQVGVADRTNMVHKGTRVTAGRGRALVVATGGRTELGRIALLLREAPAPRTPLQRRLTVLGQGLAWVALAVCALVFTVGLIRGEAPLLMFLTAVSLAVAAIPEALPAVVTVSLALGARAMVAKKALIRRLPAVETLGSVTFVCADKTGTLTRNEMRVEVIQAGAALANERDLPEADRPAWTPLCEALALSNDAQCAAAGHVVGDPTEVALYRAALDAGYDKTVLEQTAVRVAELPFTPERKCMTTFHRAPAGLVAFTKGAPEHVVERCTAALTHAGDVPLDRAPVLRRAEELAGAGMRVLAVAQRRWNVLPESLEAADSERELTFLGLVGLIDPPRPEAAPAVALCRSAGIHPVMITGDHPATARAVARRVGIIDDGDSVLAGAELARLSDDELRDCVRRIAVYARVAPEQKIRIIEALQARGECVAMTGDGVNDAPALQRADVGVAMGVVGTDVAREAADMILLDDNFATIVGAVREGRRIFDNIRKFVRYAVTTNSAEIWTMFLAPLLGMPIPLLPIQILWINLITDGLPGLALAVEPEERGIMRRPPRPPAESIFARGLWQHVLWVGLLMAGCTLLVQAWAWSRDLAHWQTMVFAVLSLTQMAHVLAIRSEEDSLFRQGIASNRPLLGAVLLTLLLQLAVVYVPVFHAIFKTAPLSAAELGLSVAAAAVVFVAVEIEKWAIRRGWLYRNARNAT
jgi:Ca2+-transporting ATPase